MNISIRHEYIKECGQEMPIVVNFPNINPCISVESVRLQVMHPFQVCNLENCHSNVHCTPILSSGARYIQPSKTYPAKLFPICNQ